MILEPLISLCQKVHLLVEPFYILLIDRETSVEKSVKHWGGKYREETIIGNAALRGNGGLAADRGSGGW